MGGAGGEQEELGSGSAEALMLLQISAAARKPTQTERSVQSRPRGARTEAVPGACVMQNNVILSWNHEGTSNDEKQRPLKVLVYMMSTSLLF